MATLSMEKRLLTLEERLAAMERLLEERLPAPIPPVRDKEKQGWQAIVGTFADDPIYDAAMVRGRAWRDAQRDEEPSR